MENGVSDEEQRTGLIALTAEIVSAYVANNTLSVAELPVLTRAVHEALSTLGAAPRESEPPTLKATPAQIRKSIMPDALISFEDGKPYKTLKRHLSAFGLSIAQYRAKWGLPDDYPTVAPSYSAARSAMAKALGLGQGGRKAKGRGKR